MVLTQSGLETPGVEEALDWTWKDSGFTNSAAPSGSQCPHLYTEGVDQVAAEALLGFGGTVVGS